MEIVINSKWDHEAFTANRPAITKAHEYLKKHKSQFTLHELKVRLFNNWSYLHIEKLLFTMVDLGLVEFTKIKNEGEVYYTPTFIDNGIIGRNLVTKHKLSTELTRNEVLKIIEEAKLLAALKDIDSHFIEILSRQEESNKLKKLKKVKNIVLKKYESRPALIYFNYDFPEKLILKLIEDSKYKKVIPVADHHFYVNPTDRSIIKDGIKNSIFYRLLIDKLIFKINDLEGISILSKPETEAKSKGLSIPQIAIIHFYNGNQITRKNGNEIAKQHNHNSGERLFQKFTYFSSPANRKGKPTLCTPKKLKNKIELFESIVSHLTDAAKNRANDEIQILNTLYESEYQ